MKKLFLSSLTKAMNTYLGLDAESRPRLKKLRGKIITLELLPFNWVFQCSLTEKGLSILDDENVVADTTIRGTPLRLVGVMLAKDHRQRFFAEDVVIEGNAEVGQQVIALFDALQIDWEEPLSRLIGDVPTYHVSRFSQRVKAWIERSEHRFTQDVSDYLHEEKQWLPAREALHDFFEDIDNLRMDVDRIEAKINLLTNGR
jgi:ubiquinone biosynthesis accessory factor UbiJ